MASFGENLKAIRVARGMSQDEFAELLGTSKQVISRYENSQRSPKFTVAAKYANLLGVSLALLNGESELPLPHPDLLPVKRVKIPLVGGIGAGEPIRADEQYDTYVEAESDVHCDYALRVDGDSMEPTICLGDLVFIRRQDDVDDGEIAAVLMDDSATLKHVYHIKNGLTLTSDNAKYPPRTVVYPEYDTIRILGKAVAFKRML